MKHENIRDERGIALILEIIAICLVLTVVGLIGFGIYKKRGGSFFGSPVTSAYSEDLAHAHNALGFNIIKDLNHGQSDNVFISPTSIALALSMVYNGASGETKQAMANTLQLKDLDILQINQQSLGLINLLNNPDKGVELSIANSIWTRKGVDLNSDFSKTAGDYYHAQSTALNFDEPDAAKKINSWVDTNTNGKIPSIIDGPIAPENIMYLINATYFKGAWTKSFDKSQTEERTFTPNNGEPYKVPMMYQHGEDFSYHENDDFQSVSLPYGEDERLAMYVFLPKDLEKFTDSVDTTKWKQWMSGYKESKGTVLLPRFKMDYSKELEETLTALGMGVAFSNQADFTGIASEVSISQVTHKTVLEISEEGTEAAAVTEIGMGITSVGGPSNDAFYMELNRPFFLAITDTKTKEILFAGAINRPT